MKFDVIRSVEACYASAADDRGWLDGLLEGLSPLENGLGIFAQVLRRNEMALPRFDARARWASRLVRSTMTTTFARLHRPTPFGGSTLRVHRWIMP